MNKQAPLSAPDELIHTTEIERKRGREWFRDGGVGGSGSKAPIATFERVDSFHFHCKFLNSKG
jgi:hypothetical protein